MKQQTTYDNEQSLSTTSNQDRRKDDNPSSADFELGKQQEKPTSCKSWHHKSGMRNHEPGFDKARRKRKDETRQRS